MVQMIDLNAIIYTLIVNNTYTSDYMILSFIAKLENPGNEDINIEIQNSSAGDTSIIHTTTITLTDSYKTFFVEYMSPIHFSYNINIFGVNNNIEDIHWYKWVKDKSEQSTFVYGSFNIENDFLCKNNATINGTLNVGGNVVINSISANTINSTDIITNTVSTKRMFVHLFQLNICLQLIRYI